MKNSWVLIAVFALIISVGFTLALENSLVSLNKTSEIEEKAKTCLDNSENIINLMEKEGFNVRRVNDSYNEAKDAYETQAVFKEKNRSSDFFKVIPICENIDLIYKNAVNARDEFAALGKFYNNSFEKGANKSSVELIVAKIKEEIANERYENVQPMIEKAYQEIINIKSSQTTLNLFYETTTGGIKKFLYKNWKAIVILCTIAIVLFLIYRIKIRKWIIERKIKKLELRKKTIRELIMQTQKSYFSHGSISEASYNIKTKKFAELMRDLERQIPLLQEERAKLERKKK